MNVAKSGRITFIPRKSDGHRTGEGEIRRQHQSEFQMTFASSARSCAVLLFAALTSCSDSPTQVQPAGQDKATDRATVLVAITPTTFADVVGASPNQPPAVIAQDSNGDPVKGITVSFTIVSGGGQIHHGGKTSDGVVVSNDAGIATMPGWRLGTAPGENKVIASSGSLASVTFTAITVHSPYLAPRKLVGDDEVGAPGRTIAIPPGVLVVDVYGNRVAGVPVTFTVLGGGGSLAGANAVSDASGIAAVTSWTLGQIGRQEISATYPNGVRPMIFSAVAIDEVDPSCESVGTLPAAVVVHADLGSGGCETSSGRRFDIRSVNVADDGLYRFFLSSAGFDTYLEVFDSSGVRVARTDIRDNATKNSRIDAFLPKGRYILLATAISPVTSGSYDISWNPGAVQGCDVPVITPNVLVNANIRSCPTAPFGLSSDRYRIYLRTGAAISIKLQFFDGYLEPALSVTNAAGSVFAEVSNNEYLAKEILLGYVAPADGYYSIAVSYLPVDFPYALMVK